jgi:broad specificity phosphatase PhoE
MMILRPKTCRVALACAAACSPRSIGVQAFGALVLPNTPRTFSSSTSLQESNRLQEYEALRNSYFALRHGQSLANVAKIIASNPEVACSQYGLSALGQEQAQAAGWDVVSYYRSKHEEGSPFCGMCLVTSDLLRAKETAEAVAAAIQTHNDSGSPIQIPLYQDQVITETRLRERGFGDWDLTSDSNYDEVWKDDAFDPTHTLRGVESVSAVMDRVTECVLDWDIRLEDFMVVCVAHGDVLQILQTSFSKLDGTKHRTLEHLETATLRKLELKKDDFDVAR